MKGWGGAGVGGGHRGGSHPLRGAAVADAPHRTALRAPSMGGVAWCGAPPSVRPCAAARDCRGAPTLCRCPELPESDAHTPTAKGDPCAPEGASRDSRWTDFRPQIGYPKA